MQNNKKHCCETWLCAMTNGYQVQLGRSCHSNNPHILLLNLESLENLANIWEWWNLLYRLYHRIFGKIKCNYPDYLFQSTFQCCLWTSGVCAKGFWLSRVDSIILMVWWQEGHPISSINLASSKSVSKPHVFTPSNRDLPHQILSWLFHCCPVLCFFDIIFLSFSIDIWAGLDFQFYTMIDGVI